jgi:acetyl-CoA carboxylase carboxyl transferase subunit beta
MADRLKITPRDLLEMGIVDGVVPEPEGGSQAAADEAATNLKRAVCDALRELSTMDAAGLRTQRKRRFRRFGSEQAAVLEGAR